jgi:protein-S-isoprenylcysteine O-methyltransferase Ste14
VPLAWPGVDDAAGHMVGLAIGAAGIGLLIWAAMTLKRHQTTIRPDKGADRLVTDGPFRFRRNPIYIAHVLIMFGVAELTGNIWFVILALAHAVLVTWLAILPEERHLEARFGDDYRAYKAKTRRWI